jgi:hypothetical protein
MAVLMRSSGRYLTPLYQNYLKHLATGVIQVNFDGSPDAVIWKIPQHQFTLSTVGHMETGKKTFLNILSLINPYQNYLKQPTTGVI